MFKQLSLLLLVLSFAFVGHAVAQQSDTSKSSRSKQKQTMKGTISNVDKAGNTVTLQGNNQQNETVTVQPDTVIMVDGNSVTLADLQTGEAATITSDGDTAVRIDVVDAATPSSSQPGSGANSSGKGSK